MLNTSFKGRPLKVLVLPSWYPPDGGWFFRDQAHFLAMAGVDVAVAYPRPVWSREVLPDLSRFELLSRGCEVVDDRGVLSLRRHWLAIPSRGRLEPWQTARVAGRLFRDAVARWGWPDLIHAHSSMWAGYAAYSLERHYGVPYIITEHRGRFSLPTAAAASLLQPWHRPYLSQAVNSAQTVVLVGSGLATQLSPLLHADVPFEVIPNGVDTGFFSPPTHTSAEGFTFAFVGHLDAQKGVHNLVAAFGLVHRDAPDARLVLVGDGPEKDTLMHAAEDAGIGPHVDFAGQLDPEGVRQVLHKAHVCVLPSEFEGLPVSLIEAMATGLPVIATEGTPPELFPAYAGLRVPVGDRAALAQAMTRVMNDYASYDRERIRDFAVGRYDFRAVAERLVGVYERCADAGYSSSPWRLREARVQ